MDLDTAERWSGLAQIGALGVAALPIPGARVTAAAIEGGALLGPLLIRHLGSQDSYKFSRSYMPTRLQPDMQYEHRRKRKIKQRH
jgi:hypothetical protein